MLPCTTTAAVPVNEQVSYRVPIVATGYRLAAGYRLRLALTSDDHDPAYPAISPDHQLWRLCSSRALCWPKTAAAS